LSRFRRVWMGYGWRKHAPGGTGKANALASAHHLLLGHGRAVEAIRRETAGVQIGITLNLIPVYPAGSRAHYGPKRIYVTENGAAFRDVRIHDGSVQDPERQQYLEGYLGACSSAIDDGVPLAGYFVWSLMDNFEWAHGYWMRFGIVYVDYRTLERVPKQSARWYSNLISQHLNVDTNEQPNYNAALRPVIR